MALGGGTKGTGSAADVPADGFLLEVGGIRKGFPGVLALDDVSFRLRRGSVHAAEFAATRLSSGRALK